MKSDVIEVKLKVVTPTPNGCAIFLGNEEKTFVIYVDQSIGNAISMTLNKVKKERPLTHDLISSIFGGLGVEIERIIINHFDEGTYYARLILQMENELGIKYIEVDARPSDCIVLALQSEKPIYTARHVFEEVEDMTNIVDKILKQQN